MGTCEPRVATDPKKHGISRQSRCLNEGGDLQSILVPVIVTQGQGANRGVAGHLVSIHELYACPSLFVARGVIEVFLKARKYLEPGAYEPGLKE